MPAKIIAVTGISGSGSREFCRKYRDKSKTEKIRIYHTGDMIYEMAQRPTMPSIPKENLLNLYPRVLDEIRNRVFDNLLKNIENDIKFYDRILIDMHAKFFWNNTYCNALDRSVISKIPIDMFITIIDKPSSIKERQMQARYGRTQKHDLKDILCWQDEEVNETSELAKFAKKPYYIFSSKQDPKVIDPLFENSFLIYLSFPMTHASFKDKERINNFKEKLRIIRKFIDNYETPMIDPADIDLESNLSLEEREKEADEYQTVHRDLKWFIGQDSTHVVAFYPSGKISKGVSDECTYAFNEGKTVFVIFPMKEMSPFMRRITSETFTNEKKFFEAFSKHLREKLSDYRR